ncbi:hypothetical protein SeMB42_g03189 [Synchytrium endobioticum]|nr:hypothetical protein SeMB42_g03189 [Synchytrium endobioticum]
MYSSPGITSSSRMSIVGINEATPLWSSILSNTSSSRSVPSKNILIVGDQHSGKTTIVQHLKHTTSHQRNPEQEQADESDELGLSYSYLDIRDDDDIAARVGIYQLATHAAYSNLIQFGLNAKTIADLLIVLVLDWTKPWSFVHTLQSWLSILEAEVEQLETQQPELMSSLRERQETFVRTYTDVGESTPVTGLQHHILLPLGQGCLVKNLGIPLIVVCAKSDAMSKLERDYKEEVFDFIQQTLRSTCLKYGASLFYVSRLRPETLSNMKQYILHKLLSNSSSNGFNAIQRISSSYQFTTKAQVVERDVIFIPSGWDSWGKIRIIKDSFDCSTMAGLSENGDTIAKRTYEDVIRRTSSDIGLSINTAITVEDEQDFLERLAEQLQAAGGVATTAATATNGMTSTTTLPSLASTTSLGGESLDDVSAKLAKLAKRPDPSKLKTAEQRSSSVADILHNASSTDSSAAGSQPSQNEVLANFFQNLLNKKSPTSATGPQRSIRAIKD